MEDRRSYWSPGERVCAAEEGESGGEGTRLKSLHVEFCPTSPFLLPRLVSCVYQCAVEVMWGFQDALFVQFRILYLVFIGLSSSSSSGILCLSVCCGSYVRFSSLFRSLFCFQYPSKKLLASRLLFRFISLDWKSCFEDIFYFVQCFVLGVHKKKLACIVCFIVIDAI